jgi:lambda family phage portal protein
VPLQLQVLEADQLDRNKDWRTEDGGKIVQGVEFDPVGRPRAVHLLRSHPGDAVYAPGEAWVSDPISYADIAHLYDEDRPGMARGVPWLTPVGRSLRDLNRYEDNELSRKRAESCTVGVVTGGLDDEPGEGDADNRITPALTDAWGRVIERMVPGQFLYTPPGRDIRFHTPTPTQGYREYIQALLHRVASGLSLPYYTISGDLREANYSSARIGDVDARAWVRPWQEQVLVPMLLEPIAQWFTEAAVVSGALPAREYTVRWTLPAVEEHDREAAARADALEVRYGLAALSDRQAARGQVPGELLERIRESNEALDGRGIVVDSDPRRTTYAGGMQPHSPVAPNPT